MQAFRVHLYNIGIRIYINFELLDKNATLLLFCCNFANKLESYRKRVEYELRFRF